MGSFGLAKSVRQSQQWIDDIANRIAQQKALEKKQARQEALRNYIAKAMQPQTKTVTQTAPKFQGIMPGDIPTPIVTPETQTRQEQVPFQATPEFIQGMGQAAGDETPDIAKNIMSFIIEQAKAETDAKRAEITQNAINQRQDKTLAASEERLGKQFENQWKLNEAGIIASEDRIKRNEYEKDKNAAGRTNEDDTDRAYKLGQEINKLNAQLAEQGALFQKDEAGNFAGYNTETLDPKTKELIIKKDAGPEAAQYKALETSINNMIESKKSELEDIQRRISRRMSEYGWGGDKSAPKTTGKKVVKTGTDKTTGKKVVQYDDGTIEYAD